MSTYRTAAPPPAERFPLALPTATAVGLGISMLSLAASTIALASGGAGFVFLAAGAAPAIAYAVGGAPRRIEVHHDRVVVRFWARPARTYVGRELTVQRSPDELVLIDPHGTWAISAELFGERSIDACAGALRDVAAHFTERAPPR